MGRSVCCDKVGLKKGPWTPDEDRKLLSYIQQHGHGSWRALPPKAGLQRCGKSCRLRWTNYLRPDIKRGKFTSQEEQTIIQLHALLGNRWSAIASHLPRRTDNEIKNYWNTHLKKRLAKMGIDPTTHKPVTHTLGSGQPKDLANLSHMAQWESARLEAEARIVRESKLAYHQLSNKATVAAPPPPKAPCLDILKVWQGLKATNTKDINTPTHNGFFASTKTLESSSSILNFSDKIIANAHNVGLAHVTAFGSEDNYMKTSGNDDPQIKGITGISSMQLLTTSMTDPRDSTNYYYNNIGDSLKFPNLLEGYTEELAPGIGCPTADNNDLLEDSKVSYWTNILNSVTSPMDSPIF